MKRPKHEYDGNTTFNIYTYSYELEKYCDQLEEIISKDDCVSHYKKKIETLEKAFDKACDVIADLNSCSNFCSLIYGACPFEKKCCDYGCVSDKENWKEWCLNDGEDK